MQALKTLFIFRNLGGNEIGMRDIALSGKERQSQTCDNEIHSASSSLAWLCQAVAGKQVEDNATVSDIA